MIRQTRAGMRKGTPRHNDPVDPKDLDASIRPQDDFFAYAAGGWLIRNPIPANESSWGAFSELHVMNEKRLHALVKATEHANAAHGSPEQLVRDLWISGMDMKRRNALGFDPIAPYAERIKRIDSKEALLAHIAEAHQGISGAAWGIGVGPDDHRADIEILHIGQGGLSLPDRDYYLKKGEEYESVRAAYRAYIGKMLALYGHSKGQAKDAADAIIAFETKLARVSMTRVERRDPHAQYNPHAVAALARLAPQIDWKRYLEAIGVAPKKVNVAQPKFIAAVARMVESVPLEDWRAYLLWHLVNGNASALSEKTGALSFDFYGRALQGQETQKPLWRRVISVIDGLAGDALGQLYVAEYFPEEAKRDMDRLARNVIAATGERIRNLEWMTAATKKKALAKLAVIRPKIGYPEKWISYRGLSIKPDDFFGNVVRANRFEHRRAMKKVDKPVDPAEWEMTPSTVNAYFHPNKNEIVFPAGILQPPFFDMRARTAFNYGAIGSIIGHEITHAFDDEGRKFDAKGNLKDWWTKEDAVQFEKRAKVLEKQYSAFEPLPGFHINGKLTLGENIADLGGLLIAYDAWQRSRTEAPSALQPGAFTDEQLFFFGLASAEKGHIREPALKKRLVTDPHSPSRFRVNGPFPNIDAFYEAFGVQPADRMYLSPAKRARIW